MHPRAHVALTYILPIKARTPQDNTELTSYLAWLSRCVDVVVVDSSEPDVFAAHHTAWSRHARHVPPDPGLVAPVGKVSNVLTGLRLARNARVIIADDDVRYDALSLRRVARSLDDYDVVRPQNYFDPLPWHAVWDTGRILLNRVAGGDWPGTLGVRRDSLARAGGYDGRAMFENLELVRTVLAVGGQETVLYDAYVRRIPCGTAHFWSQRVRQAFDEFARPERLAIQLALLPAIISLVRARRWGTLAAGITTIVAVAELGRRRDDGRSVFPPAASFAAPAWVAERALTSWLAIATRVTRGGVIYQGQVINLAASPSRVLRRRFAHLNTHATIASSCSSTSMGLNEPLLDNSAEHAVTPT
ncbi:MAG TPA: hypothetical protein VIG47_10110 [Gemmatimonadaceae bacterium]